MIEFLQREKSCHVKCKFVVQVVMRNQCIFLKIVYIVVVCYFSYQSIMLFGFYRVIGENTRIMIDLNVQ